MYFWWSVFFFLTGLRCVEAKNCDILVIKFKIVNSDFFLNSNGLAYNQHLLSPSIFHLHLSLLESEKKIHRQS